MRVLRDLRDPGTDRPPLVRVLREFQPRDPGAVVTTPRAGDRAWADSLGACRHRELRLNSCCSPRGGRAQRPQRAPSRCLAHHLTILCSPPRPAEGQRGPSDPTSSDRTAEHAQGTDPLQPRATPVGRLLRMSRLSVLGLLTRVSYPSGPISPCYFLEQLNSQGCTCAG